MSVDISDIRSPRGVPGRLAPTADDQPTSPARTSRARRCATSRTRISWPATPRGTPIRAARSTAIIKARSTSTASKPWRGEGITGAGPLPTGGCAAHQRQRRQYRHCPRLPARRRPRHRQFDARRRPHQPQHHRRLRPAHPDARRLAEPRIGQSPSPCTTCRSTRIITMSTCRKASISLSAPRRAWWCWGKSLFLFPRTGARARRRVPGEGHPHSVRRRPRARPDPRRPVPGPPGAKAPPGSLPARTKPFPARSAASSSPTSTKRTKKRYWPAANRGRVPRLLQQSPPAQPAGPVGCHPRNEATRASLRRPNRRQCPGPRARSGRRRHRRGGA